MVVQRDILGSLGEPGHPAAVVSTKIPAGAVPLPTTAVSRYARGATGGVAPSMMVTSWRTRQPCLYSFVMTPSLVD